MTSDINIDVQICKSEIKRCQSEMIMKSKALKTLVETLKCNEINKYKCLLQKIRGKEYIARIQIYEHKYEQSANRSFQFFRFIKNVSHPKREDTVTQEINIGELIKLLSNVQTTESIKRKLNKGNKLTLMSSPMLQKFITLTGIDFCDHISCLTPDRVWVSDENNIF